MFSKSNRTERYRRVQKTRRHSGELVGRRDVVHVTRFPNRRRRDVVKNPTPRRRRGRSSPAETYIRPARPIDRPPEIDVRFGRHAGRGSLSVAAAAAAAALRNQLNSLGYIKHVSPAHVSRLLGLVPSVPAHIILVYTHGLVCGV